MKCVISIVLLTLSTVSFASTDYQCLSNCVLAGYSHGYCDSICSY